MIRKVKPRRSLPASKNRSRLAVHAKPRTRLNSSQQDSKEGNLGQKRAHSPEEDKKELHRIHERTRLNSSQQDSKEGNLGQKRAHSPEEDKKELHRIHERQRHHSLNVAIRKIISTMPSCEPNEPETKHYVLRKTSDYIQFLEDKISELCAAMHIEPQNRDRNLSFSSPIYTCIDGVQKEIAANVPVSLNDLEELMSNLNFRMTKSRSFRSKRKSCRNKRSTGMKKTQTSCPSAEDENKILDEADHFYQEGKDSQEEVAKGEKGDSQESFHGDASGSSMMCSESPTDLDSSGVSNTNTSSSSSWGTTSVDDGFASGGKAQESTQEDRCSTHSSQEKEETLSDLLGRDIARLKTKYIPSKEQVDSVNKPHSSGITETRQDWVAVLAGGVSSLQKAYQGHSHSLESSCGEIPFPATRGCKAKRKQPESGVFLPILPSSSYQSLELNHKLGLPHGTLIQNDKTSGRSDNIASVQSSHIVNPSLTHQSKSNPRTGFKKRSLATGRSCKTRGDAGSSMSYTSINVSNQGLRFQPVEQTVDIPLDVGPDPQLLSSIYGLQFPTKRTWLNGYQLFTKVNQKRFRDGWPHLKDKEVAKVVSQAWQQLSEPYRKLYSQGAREWNRWYKHQVETKH
ncbi:uncharacterized protein [Diadema antillarum]|uniref:uncharacterized protein n=1 Tax=Diadema antillarum TaxID=105358 RepID=UPI003A8939F2